MKNKININIGIVGGGIASLVFANLLKNNKKFKIKIFEKNKIKTTAKTGIQISNNARRILNKINFNQLDKKKFCEIRKVNISEYENKKKISHLSMNHFNNREEEYVSLDRNLLINFLIKQTKKKIDFCYEEVISVKKNTIYFEKKKEEKFDIVVVDDGIFSKIRGGMSNYSLQKISAVAYRGVVRGYNFANSSNVDLFLGDNKHFVFYPINKMGDFSFTSIFSTNSNALKKDYSSISSKRELMNMSCNANSKIKKIISLTNAIYRWPIYQQQKIYCGKNKTFVIGDASHAMAPFQAQGAAQSIEDAFCLSQMFKNNIFDVKYFESLRRDRVKMILEKSYKSLFIYHLNNLLTKQVRNFFIKIICKYRILSNFYFGKIYNYKFKD